MSKRPLIFALLPFAALLLSFAIPFIIAASKAKGGLARGIRTDNIATTGKVISVGPSTVGNGPSVILYSYDAPGFPRNGNSGSFTREQVAASSDLRRFRPGGAVSVEYSRTSPGSSRIKGFGTGSVFVSEFLPSIKFFAPILIVSCFGIIMAILRGQRQG